jgi:hypothetical protein
MLRVLILCVALQAPAYPSGAVSIQIETTRVIHTMRGGAGASWHAIGLAAFTYWPSNRHNRNARGSGWGGNPPLAYEQAWKDLRAHARWLGLDFLRVEIDARMYEPERGRFEWDNEEMRTLYRILDICEELKADVFLTQMWQNVEWNAFPAAGRRARSRRRGIGWRPCDRFRKPSSPTRSRRRALLCIRHTGRPRATQALRASDWRS